MGEDTKTIVEKISSYNIFTNLFPGAVFCYIVNKTTLIISKKPGNTGISRDIRTEFTTDLLLSD